MSCRPERIPGIKFGDLRTPEGAAQMIDRLLGRMKPGRDANKGHVTVPQASESH
jgi:hypothetical protein